MKSLSFVELKIVKAPESTGTNGYLEAANKGEIVNFLNEHILMDKGRDAALAPAEGSKSRVCSMCVAP